MRFLRNLLLFVILIYGAAVGYLWYETNNTLQRIVEGAAPFATIGYESFFVSPLGNEITVDNISIVPQMAADEFRIEQVRLFADQPGYFLISGKSMQDGKLPEEMGINFSNIQLNLDGKFFSMLEQMVEQAAEQPTPADALISQLDALGCGDIDKFQLVDYRLMGMRRVNTDFNIRLHYNKIAEIFSVEIDANVRDIYQANMSMDFKVPGGEMGGVTATNTIPPMRISINDNGFYKMRNTYCATSNNSSIDEYIDRHMQLLVATLGIKLPEKLATAYRNHMLKGGRINVAIKPQNNISPEELTYYKPLEAAELLGLSVSIGNTRVELDQLLNADAPGAVAQSPNAAKPAAKDKAAATVTKVEKPAAMEETKAPVQRRPSYHVENVDNAEKHIDKLVEVTLPGNKVRRGILEQVRNGRLYLVIELQGGSVTYPVRKNEINKFRVRY